MGPDLPGPAVDPVHRSDAGQGHLDLGRLAGLVEEVVQVQVQQVAVLAQVAQHLGFSPANSARPARRGRAARRPSGPDRRSRRRWAGPAARPWWRRAPRRGRRGRASAPPRVRGGVEPAGAAA